MQLLKNYLSVYKEQFKYIPESSNLTAIETTSNHSKLLSMKFLPSFLVCE